MYILGFSSSTHVMFYVFLCFCTILYLFFPLIFDYYFILVHIFILFPQLHAFFPCLFSCYVFFQDFLC